jgi:malonyl-CoA O-methyltransferase
VIAGRFGAAAEAYDKAAHAQRRIAEALAHDIAAAGLAAGGRVLELGCGTGLLTAQLLPAMAPRLWIASDIAPAMLDVLRRTLDDPALLALTMDAERPCLAPPFDLVCSSLTLQWLADPAQAIAQWRALVKPGGLLAFATLLDGSFGEWRAALKAAGAAAPEPALPSLETLLGWAPGATTRVVTVTEPHAGGLDFLKAARRTGVDAGLARALDAGVMRRALKALDSAGAAATYRAALIMIHV